MNTHKHADLIQIQQEQLNDMDSYLKAIELNRAAIALAVRVKVASRLAAYETAPEHAKEYAIVRGMHIEEILRAVVSEYTGPA